jgi:hypothetical protein
VANLAVSYKNDSFEATQWLRIGQCSVDGVVQVLVAVSEVLKAVEKMVHKERALTQCATLARPTSKYTRRCRVM